jgi:hypothetical protein
MARPSALAVSALAFAASTFSLLAQSPQWRPIPVAGGPGTGLQFAFALAPLPNGDLLLFGGSSAPGPEWTWNGVRWAPLATPVPRRQGAALARNETTGELLLFGGRDASGPLTDTWSFANGTWTQLVPPATPPALVAMSMAWDPADGAMVLTGQDASALWQTWRFAGGTWSFVANLPAPAFGHVSLFSDTVRGELDALVSGGGALVVSRLRNGGWELLTQRPQAGFSQFVAAFDRDRARMVAASLSRETVEYDGLQLVPRQPGPPAGVFPLQFALAYDAVRKETLFAEPLTSALFRWAPEPVPLATPHGAPCASPSFALGLAPGDTAQPGSSHRLLATGGSSAALTLAVLGFSHVQNGGLPLPQPIPLGALGCLLRVEAVLIDVLGLGTPAQRLITLPNAPALLGARYDAQAVQFDASGVTDSSNGLEVQIGLPLPERELLETFASSAARDPVASGDVWGNGGVAPVALGGDGRHGSFDAALGAQVAPNVFEWSTTATTIPAASTLTGTAQVVTDGRFFFTDFVVPAGVTVRFTGALPAQVFVRGLVDVRGTVSVDAPPMPGTVATTGPLAGLVVSTFNARGALVVPNPLVLGQPGGLGGAGGGAGGNGGNECAGTGPLIIGGVNVNNGQPGQDVRVAAGHAYAGNVAGTGGRGSPLHPALGTIASAGVPFIQGAIQFRDEFSPGGGGGGFTQPGGVAATPVIPAPAVTQPNVGPIAPGGAAFALLPFVPAPGYSSLQHFLVGGSGGGGGGCHTFGTATPLADVFVAGHGGSGGGGALALRAGGAVAVSGTLSSRGGEGVLITGNNPLTAAPDVDLGVSSPGGGGSGGSIVLQSAATVAVSGTIDTSGGTGSRVSNVASSLAPPPTNALNVQAQAGAGSPGSYRLEANGAVTFTGAAVPAFVPASNAATLTDRDATSGSRSTWLLPATTALPYYLRYELLADVGGVPVLFSDDPAVSPLAANDPGGAVLLRVQGARLDPVTGAVLPNTIGPWRTRVMPGTGSLNADRATALRFDLVVDTTVGPVAVRELRIVWR